MKFHIDNATPNWHNHIMKTFTQKLKLSVFSLYCKVSANGTKWDPFTIESHRANEYSLTDALLVECKNSIPRGLIETGSPKFVLWGVFACPAEKDSIENRLDKEIVIAKLKGEIPMDDDEMGKRFN